MADFNFTVDTTPMADEINQVSGHVDAVTGAVVAMQAAVIEAERESADNVCSSVNRGFYSMMHSQITQKIAQLSSTVEAKLLQMGEYASALKGIQSKMGGDYNRISARYSKTFRSINNTLQARISQLDAPVFQLVNRDVKLLDSRVRLNSAQFDINQLESIMGSQLIATSKLKLDADKALTAITKYIAETMKQTKQSDASMEERKIDSVEEISLPVSIVESSSETGKTYVNYYVAKSGNQVIDESVNTAVREHSINSVLSGEWEDIKDTEMEKIEFEFSNLIANSDDDNRIKDEIMKMFNASTHIQQLKPGKK